MDTLYQIEDRTLLIDLLNGDGGFHRPKVVLHDLTAEQATTKVSGLPHSIAEIVAHMSYWQEWFNACATTGYTGLPEHASIGWPAVSSGEWDTVKSRFFAAIEGGKRIASTSGGLQQPLLPTGVENPFLAKESQGSGLLHAAVHSAHHLGQIITIRQLKGLWPPPAGSMTW